MIGTPIGKYGVESISRASIHVILGIVPWIVRCIRKAYRRLEQLEAGAQAGKYLPTQLREKIEWALEKTEFYEKYLEQELRGTINAVSTRQSSAALRGTRTIWKSEKLNIASSAGMYYVRALRGVPMMHRESCLPVQLSVDAYGKILDKIEDNGYDTLTKRKYVGKWEKLAGISAW